MGWRERVRALNEAALLKPVTAGSADDDPWFGKKAAGADSVQPERTAELAPRRSKVKNADS